MTTLFARRKNSAINGRIDTVIGAGTRVKGEIASTGTIRVDGHFEGVLCSEGTIVIGQGGTVEASIIGGKVIIGGRVKGTVEAHDRVELLTTGRVYGDIKTPKLSVAEGVLFEGKCIMAGDNGPMIPQLPPGTGSESI